MRSTKISIGTAALFTILIVSPGISTPRAAAQTETVLFSFGAPPAPSRGGINPSGTLVLDAKGNLYGTTTFGGHSSNCSNDGQTSCGVAFQLAPKADGSWAEKVLHAFTNNGTDGAYPEPMIFDAQGNLYGTTSSGGLYGQEAWYFGGTALELSPTANGSWTEQILYNFQTNSSVGGTPVSIIFDAVGNLYGITSGGGPGTSEGCGSVFELTPGAGGIWTGTALYPFEYGNGGCGGLSLALDAAGDPFGTVDDGKYAGGVVFELAPGSGGTWADVILKSFNDHNGPWYPNSLVVDSHGDVYGTACDGAGASYKYGSVFELSPGAGGIWTYGTVYAFTSTADGTCPAGLILDTSGNLYGVTKGGGADNYGTVFELTSANGIWTKTILHSFSSGSDGSEPNSITLAASGVLYGTTVSGGVYNGGTVFKIVP